MAGQLPSCSNTSQLCQCHGWTPFAKPWSRESPSLQQQCLFPQLVDGLETPVLVRGAHELDPWSPISSKHLLGWTQGDPVFHPLY